MFGNNGGSGFGLLKPTVQAGFGGQAPGGFGGGFGSGLGVPAAAPAAFGFGMNNPPASQQPLSTFGGVPPAPTFSGMGTAFGAPPAPVFGAPNPGFGAPQQLQLAGLGGAFGGPAPQAAPVFAPLSGGANFGAAPMGAVGAFSGQPQQQQSGTGNPKWASTPDPDSAGKDAYGRATNPTLSFVTIEAMPSYAGRTKSTEELRWDDKMNRFYGPLSTQFSANAGQPPIFGAQPAGRPPGFGAFGPSATAPTSMGAFPTALPSFVAAAAAAPSSAWPMPAVGTPWAASGASTAPAAAPQPLFGFPGLGTGAPPAQPSSLMGMAPASQPAAAFPSLFSNPSVAGPPPVPAPSWNYEATLAAAPPPAAAAAPGPASASAPKVSTMNTTDPFALHALANKLKDSAVNPEKEEELLKKWMEKDTLSDRRPDGARTTYLDVQSPILDVYPQAGAPRMPSRATPYALARASQPRSRMKTGTPSGGAGQGQSEGVQRSFAAQVSPPTASGGVRVGSEGGLPSIGSASLNAGSPGLGVGGVGSPQDMMRTRLSITSGGEREGSGRRPSTAAGTTSPYAVSGKELREALSHPFRDRAVTFTSAIAFEKQDPTQGPVKAYRLNDTLLRAMRYTRPDGSGVGMASKVILTLHFPPDLEETRLQFLKSARADGPPLAPSMAAVFDRAVPEDLSPQQELLLAAFAAVPTLSLPVSPQDFVWDVKVRGLAHRRARAVRIVEEYRSLVRDKLSGSAGAGAGAGLQGGDTPSANAEWPASLTALMSETVDLDKDARMLCPLPVLEADGEREHSDRDDLFVLAHTWHVHTDDLVSMLSTADCHVLMTAHNRVLVDESEDGDLTLGDVGVTASAEVHFLYQNYLDVPDAFMGAGDVHADRGGRMGMEEFEDGSSLETVLSSRELPQSFELRSEAQRQYVALRARRPDLKLPKLPDFRMGYWTSPCPAELAGMGERGILHSVPNFAVSKVMTEDFGEVQWCDPLDLRNEDVNEACDIDLSPDGALCIKMYEKPGTDKPAVGYRMNKAARITYSIDRADTSEEEKELEMSLRKNPPKGAMFSHYDPVGRVTYLVQHFSGYGLPASARKKARRVDGADVGTGVGGGMDFHRGNEAASEGAQPSRGQAQVQAWDMPTFHQHQHQHQQAMIAVGAGFGLSMMTRTPAKPPLAPLRSPQVMGDRVAIAGRADGSMGHIASSSANFAPAPMPHSSGVFSLPASARQRSKSANRRPASASELEDDAEVLWGGEEVGEGSALGLSALGSTSRPTHPTRTRVTGAQIPASELAYAQSVGVSEYLVKEQQSAVRASRASGPFVPLSRYTTGAGTGSGTGNIASDAPLRLLQDWEEALRGTEARRAQEGAPHTVHASLPDPDAVPPPPGYDIKRPAWNPVVLPASVQAARTVPADASYAHELDLLGALTAPGWPWARASVLQHARGRAAGKTHDVSVNLVDGTDSAHGLDAHQVCGLLMGRAHRASLFPPASGSGLVVAHRGLPLALSAQLAVHPFPLALATSVQLKSEMACRTPAEHAAMRAGAQGVPALASSRVFTTRGSPPLAVSSQAISLPFHGAGRPWADVPSAKELLSHQGRHWVKAERDDSLPPWARFAQTDLQQVMIPGIATMLRASQPLCIELGSGPDGGLTVRTLWHLSKRGDATRGLTLPAAAIGEQVYSVIRDMHSAAGAHAKRDAERASSSRAHDERMRAGASAHAWRLWGLLHALWGQDGKGTEAQFGRTYGSVRGSPPGGDVASSSAMSDTTHTPPPQPAVRAVAAALCDPLLTQHAAMVSSRGYRQAQAHGARRECLAAWLQSSLALPSTPHATPPVPLGHADCVSGRWKAWQVHAGILAALLRRDLPSAVALASRSGHHHLSILLSQAGCDESVRDLLAEQVDGWCKGGGEAQGPSPPQGSLLAVYMLLAGMVTQPPSSGCALDGSRLPWQLALSAHLWYACPPGAPVRSIFAAYERALADNAAAVPTPWYLAHNAQGQLGSRPPLHGCVASAVTALYLSQPAVSATPVTLKEEAALVMAALGVMGTPIVLDCTSFSVEGPVDGSVEWRARTAHLAVLQEERSTSSPAQVVLSPHRDALYTMLQLYCSSPDFAGVHMRSLLSPPSHGPSVTDYTLPWQLASIALALTNPAHTRRKQEVAIRANRDAERQLEAALATLAVPVSPAVRAHLRAVLLPACARDETSLGEAPLQPPLWGVAPAVVAAVSIEHAEQVARAGAWHWAVACLLQTAGSLGALGASGAGTENAWEGSDVNDCAPNAPTALPAPHAAAVSSLLRVAREMVESSVPPLHQLLEECREVTEMYAPDVWKDVRTSDKAPTVSVMLGRNALVSGPAGLAVHSCAAGAGADVDPRWPSRAAWVVAQGVPRGWVHRAVAMRAVAAGTAGACVAIPALIGLLQSGTIAVEYDTAFDARLGGPDATPGGVRTWAAQRLSMLLVHQVAPALLLSYEADLKLAELEANRDPSNVAPSRAVPAPTIPVIAGCFTGLAAVVRVHADGMLGMGGEEQLHVLPDGFPGAVDVAWGVPDLVGALRAIEATAVASHPLWRRKAVLVLRWCQYQYEELLPEGYRYAGILPLEPAPIAAAISDWRAAIAATASAPAYQQVHHGSGLRTTVVHPSEREETGRGVLLHWLRTAA